MQYKYTITTTVQGETTVRLKPQEGHCESVVHLLEIMERKGGEAVERYKDDIPGFSCVNVRSTFEEEIRVSNTPPKPYRYTLSLKVWADGVGRNRSKQNMDLDED